MSPETLREEHLCPAADVYSLGITMWQMKTRLTPYEWLESNDMVAYQVVKHHLRPNSTIHFRNEIPVKQFISTSNCEKEQNELRHIKDQDKAKKEKSSMELKECSCIHEKTSLLGEDSIQKIRHILYSLQVYTDWNAVEMEKHRMVATIDARCQVRTRLNFSKKDHGQLLTVPKIKSPRISPKSSPRKSPRKNSVLLNKNSSPQKLCVSCGLNKGDKPVKCLIETFHKLSDRSSNHTTFQNINDEKIYEKLYQNAWQDDRLKRPTSFQLLSELKNLAYPE